jgi:hypothetical protein
MLSRGTKYHRESNDCSNSFRFYERRADYVHAAVDGRSVTAGETTTIPIPRDRLERDRAAVRETDIAALEADIDAAVYDLFELTADERAVIEAYLDVF